MAIVRTTRYTTDSAATEEVLATRAALIDAVRAAYPGLGETRLVRLDDGTWVDMWRWDALSCAQAALAGAPAFPEAAAAFGLARDVTAEQAEIVDER